MTSHIATPLRRTAALIGILLLVGACSSTGAASSAPASAAPTAASSASATDDGYSRGSSSPAAGGAVVLKTGTGAVGTYLTGKDGLTLYTFTKDTATTSACTDACAAKWPPLIASDAAAVTADAGVTGKLTTVARADGSMQVAYNGKLLYYYATDTKAGDTNGQGVGGFWFIAAP